KIAGDDVTSDLIQTWIDLAQIADDGSLVFKRGIANLELLLAEMLPDKTELLANYPNPFNPETWIPYHLAKGTDVQITIYDIKGSVVRQLDLGQKPAGNYTVRSRAAHWDGRNNDGEKVASGIYFYQLRAGDYEHTRRMLIVK
ncbi:MAG: T9SS type A sorting domain-containing protein, partial [Candidatus Poribacteria bacterium]|nr:T9SS type A sorting domain-containing protein [Candidatus Poribacteria bacterium]